MPKAVSKSNSRIPGTRRNWCKPLDAMVAVSIEGRQVWIRPWLYDSVRCPHGQQVAILLLDTDLEQNEQGGPNSPTTSTAATTRIG